MFKVKSSVWTMVVWFAAASIAANAQEGLSFSRRDILAASAIRMTSGDYNGDRRLDVALVTNAGGVSVLLGRGDGGFEGSRDVILGPAPATFVINADVNGDGRPDLISTHLLASIVSVALGRGDGTFSPALQIPCVGPGAIVASDINGDGTPDLAVANVQGLIPSQGGTTVSVFLGRGNGAFGAPIFSPVLGQRPSSLAAGDFNRDGRADLVVTAAGVNAPDAPNVCILISNADGTFQPPRPASVSFGPYIGAAVADFNLDGRPDIALRGGPPQLLLLLGNGDGSFQPSQGPAFEGFGFIVVDMNGDNAPDVAGVSFPYNVALVLLGRGDGSFEEQQPFQVAFGPSDIAAGDFNGDGAMDMVTCHQGQAALTVLLNTTPVPVISANGVVNAASFQAGPLTVSPGEIVTIFGRNLGPPQLVPARLRTPEFLDTLLANTRAAFDGVAAPIIYTRADQISVVVPYRVSGKSTTQLQVIYGSARSAPLTLRVVPAVPGIFMADASWSGQAAAINQDGTLNSPSNPAARGSIITFFATGEGQTTPPGIDGKLSTVPLPVPTLPVIIGIANKGAEVIYVGAAPGLVAGLLQLNVLIPTDAPAGPRVPLVVQIGDVFSPPGVTLAIQ